jgi:TetR/AcrR family transcriptional regulator
MSIEAPPTSTRMRSEDRRELILQAATKVFAEYGYHGSTTDQVAKAAEVSQPYVVRMFGTKQQLFVEVLHRALSLLMQNFETQLARGLGPDEVKAALGDSYAALSQREEGLLLALMQGFVMGRDPVIGPVARAGFMKVVAFLTERVGMSMPQASDFLAGGMLINTLVGIRMQDAVDDYPHVRELMECVFLPSSGPAQ